MAWLWPSYDEFKKYVRPLELDTMGPYLVIRSESWFEHGQRINSAVQELQRATEALRKLGFNFVENPSQNDQHRLKAARELTWEITRNGEILLMYHRRLAKNKAAEEFINRKDFEPHWDRYAESRRIYMELEHFHLSALQLLDGFDELLSQDREFLVRDLDLPDNLQPDFKLARDLFSVGLDGVGLLIAGRGLEGVLRAAAKKRGMQFLRRDNRPPLPACEADFADLIDIFAKMRWRRDKSTVINKETAAFLHFLRTTRNSAAHPDLEGGHKDIKAAREQAKIAAQLAQDIWKRVTRPRAQFVTKSIQKD